MRHNDGFSPTAPRTSSFETRLPYPAADVWQWHTRPGAVVRLTPGSARMKVTAEAANLRDGTTVFSLPAGLTWVAAHDAAGFTEGHRFTDVCVSAPMRQLTRWSHRHTITGVGDGTSAVTDEITSRVPSALLGGIAAYRRRQLSEELAHLSRTSQWDAQSRTIALTGASGLVGTQLSALLRTAGHTVVPLERKKEAVQANPKARYWDPEDPASDLLDGIDTVVHLAGAPIFGRFTAEHEAAVRDSRVGPTRRLAEAAATAGVKVFVCASAVGFYGTRRPEAVDEDADRGDGILADIVSDWEYAGEPARQAGLRVVNVRTGLVLAGGSPLLTLLAASARVGGGRLGDGTQHFPWIGIDDLTDIYHHAVVDPALSGPINAVAPEDITEGEFADTLASVQTLRVPLRIPVPALGPAVLLGKTGAQELALADQHARPRVLEKLGHTFRFTTVRDLLVHESA